MLPHWPTSWWIAITLGTIIIWLFESSYREARRLQNRIDDLEKSEESPFEIIFDPNNPSKQFYSREPTIYENGKMIEEAHWEYRAKIKNNSNKTLKNVSVKVEYEGQKQSNPIDTFYKTEKTIHSLNPKYSELLPIFYWPISETGIAKLADESGLIKVSVSTDDTLPATKKFKFDNRIEPMVEELKQ